MGLQAGGLFGGGPDPPSGGVPGPLTLWGPPNPRFGGSPMGSDWTPSEGGLGPPSNPLFWGTPKKLEIYLFEGSIYGEIGGPLWGG